jgi:hypothetical protein
MKNDSVHRIHIAFEVDTHHIANLTTSDAIICVSGYLSLTYSLSFRKAWREFFKLFSTSNIVASKHNDHWL